MQPLNPKPLKLALLCPGLGHISRGFETFTAELADTLSLAPELDMRLYSGRQCFVEREGPRRKAG